MAHILSRDSILAVRLRHEDVEVPEVGGAVRVWEMSALRRLSMVEAAQKEERSVLERGAVLAATCVGDESGPFSPPWTAEEVLSLTLKSVNRLCEVAARLNVTSKEAAEEQRGNSEGEPTGASPTDSP
jgi:hypothetical protein